MLGRRAAVGVTIAALAVTGGGVSLAATHGSSHSSKPHATPRHHVAPEQHRLQGGGPTVGHHCSHTAATSADL